MTEDAAEVIFIDEASGRTRTLTGRPGESLLQIALAGGVPLEHTCGGVCACSTCHVQVVEGAAALSECEERELDQLEQAPGYGPDSRLACQAVVLRRVAGKIRCLIPKWNRNAVKENAS